jgi:methanogenic corrinoid protein MtbC1
MPYLNQQAVVCLEQYRAHPSRLEEDEKLPLALAQWLTRENDALHLLSNAIAAERPLHFAEYLAWVKMMLDQPESAVPDLVTYFHGLRDALVAALPEELTPVIDEYIDAGLRPLTEVPQSAALLEERQRYGELAQQYLEALLRTDREQANHLIMEAVEQGANIEDIYRYVLQPSQGQIGLLWKEHRVSVAQEHYCTAVTELVMAQLYTRIQRIEKKHQRGVVACVSNELHDLGARMVATFLERDGWDTTYLGANTPTSAIAEVVETCRADVLFLSATIAEHLVTVQGVVRAVRASGLDTGPQIVVGGYCFNQAPTLWRAVGADGYAPNAEEAVALANHLARTKLQVVRP